MTFVFFPLTSRTAHFDFTDFGTESGFCRALMTSKRMLPTTRVNAELGFIAGVVSVVVSAILYYLLYMEGVTYI